ncbi:MAG: hypothetical protein QF584_01045, partial [Candidatus Woesearchaeota archaeon]|nr:hypothetical protein [Candidatus Woesearchaeota archaeon]
DQVLVAPKTKKEKEEIATAELQAKTSQTEQVAEMEPQTPIDDSHTEDISSGELNSKITSKAKHEICPDCGTKTQIEEGCVGCKACGWALCK